jgi:hypothetical protein
MAEEPETFIKELECDLTEEETRKERERVPEIWKELKAIEAEKAAQMAGYNKSRKDKRAEMDAAVSAAGTGKVKREVSCYERLDFRRNVAETVRMDTEAVIDERAITKEELQQDLPGTDAGSNGATAHYPPGVGAPKADGDEEEAELTDERVFQHLMAASDPLSISEIAKALKADAAEIKTLVRTLHERGAVAQRDADGWEAIAWPMPDGEFAEVGEDAAPEPELATKKKRGRPRKTPATETVQ